MSESLIPIAQSPEVVRETMEEVIRGDVISFILNPGGKADFFRGLGFPVVHGCVWKRVSDQGLKIWNPDFPRGTSREDRTIRPDEVQWITAMRAEICVPIESGDRFQKGDMAIVGIENEELERVEIYGAIGEVLISESIKDHREILGGQEYFRPVEY